MTNRWIRWTTLLVTFAGIGLPWLFARKALDPNDPAAQAVTFLPAPYAFIIWAPIYTGFLIFARRLAPDATFALTPSRPSDTTDEEDARTQDPGSTHDDQGGDPREGLDDD